MFILYPVLVALLVGWLTGGSAARLGTMRLTWAPLIVLGMVVQLLLGPRLIDAALELATA